MNLQGIWNLEIDSMSKPWKELEKEAAKKLGGIRIVRGNDYGKSDVDVVVPDFIPLRIDCKYRSRHAHHALIEEVRSKYCADGGYPVLVTKHRLSRREYATIDLDLLGALLEMLRRKNNELQ